MGKVVVVGDVGGHLDQLRWALSLMGARGEPLLLPEDVIVVQVGDLIDRGPDSLGVLNLVEDIRQRQPGQWVQLVGNHEAQYLPGGRPFWPEPVPQAGVELLTRWWDTGAMTVATAITTADGDESLVTHAGLTAIFGSASVGERSSASTPDTADTGHRRGGRSSSTTPASPEPDRGALPGVTGSATLHPSRNIGQG